MMRVAPLILAMIWLSLASRTTAQDNAELKVGGGKIDVAFSFTPAKPLRKLVLGWVTSSARAVTLYYKRFPVSHLQLQLRFFEGWGVRGGKTIGWNGAKIAIAVGCSSTSVDFADDGC